METYNVPAKIEALERKIGPCLENIEEESSWNLVKNYQKEGLIIHARPSDKFSGKIVRGEGLIEASPEECFKHCHPRPELTRTQWDSSIKTLEIAEMIQDQGWPEVYLLRTTTHSAGMGLISQRDFLDLIINVNNDKMVGTMAESIASEKCPPHKDYVRGTNHYCGILCCRLPGEPNRTRLVYIAHSEIGGRLPVSVVNAAVPNAIYNFYAALKKQVAK
ncbi:stAR-related lipid transfer protein 5-like [Watersipora subatra]|uniref:stAR-related lipid transfer protein 5-like n=1 Tax=Watersipora subatra TaxID=2589382 RepID=UPI00355C0745